MVCHKPFRIRVYSQWLCDRAVKFDTSWQHPAIGREASRGEIAVPGHCCYCYYYNNNIIDCYFYDCDFDDENGGGGDDDDANCCCSFLLSLPPPRRSSIDAVCHSFV